MKIPLVKFYTPFGKWFWLTRFNIVWLKDLKILEITIGFLGFGMLVDVYTKDRKLENKHEQTKVL